MFSLYLIKELTYFALPGFRYAGNNLEILTITI
jgi:hypothetical protein